MTKQLSIRIYDLKISPVFKVQMLTTEPLHSKQQITLRIWYPNTLQTWLLLKNLWYSTIRSSNKMLVHWEAWITLLSKEIIIYAMWTLANNEQAHPILLLSVCISVYFCVYVCVYMHVCMYTIVCVCVWRYSCTFVKAKGKYGVSFRRKCLLLPFLFSVCHWPTSHHITILDNQWALQSVFCLSQQYSVCAIISGYFYVCPG